MNEQSSTLVDAAGQAVIDYMSDARNYSRIGELFRETVDIARAGHWRKYRTAAGPQTWRECEFDYFLIACDINREDAGRMIAGSQAGEEIGRMMISDDPTKRRTMAQAAKTYRPAGPETLETRAARLGWVRDDGRPSPPPISSEARTRITRGVSLKEQAAQNRRQAVEPARRKELDAIAARLLKEVPDPTERRYILDRLTAPRSARGPAGPSEIELARWRRDAEVTGWKATKELTEKWGISQPQAWRRIAQVRNKD